MPPSHHAIAAVFACNTALLDERLPRRRLSRPRRPW